jgi:hypothetical protein
VTKEKVTMITYLHVRIATRGEDSRYFLLVPQAVSLSAFQRTAQRREAVGVCVRVPKAKEEEEEEKVHAGFSPVTPLMAGLKET